MWWGYVYSNGHIRVKRCWDDESFRLSYKDAIESDFVRTIFRPFQADSWTDAYSKIEELYTAHLVSLKLKE